MDVGNQTVTTSVTTRYNLSYFTCSDTPRTTFEIPGVGDRTWTSPYHDGRPTRDQTGPEVWGKESEYVKTEVISP